MLKVRLLVTASLLPLVAGCTAAFVPSSINTTDLATVNFSDVQNMRRGEACSTTILSLFTQGEALVTAAARNANISRVAVVEHKISTNPLIARQCVIVFGR